MQIFPYYLMYLQSEIHYFCDSVSRIGSNVFSSLCSIAAIRSYHDPLMTSMYPAIDSQRPLALKPTKRNVSSAWCLQLLGSTSLNP